MNSDILIIGSGVIGLAIARELHKRGVRKITILERGRAGCEASWAAAGMLAPQAETDRIDDFYRICSASRDMYPTLSGQLLAETGVDIELDRSGTLYLAFTQHDVEEIRKRFEWQRAANLDVNHCSAAECRSLEPAISEGVREGLFFPRDWQVENRKLLAALVEFVRRNDITIVEETEVETILTANGRAIGAAASGVNFLAGTVILATGAWTSFIKIGETSVPVEVRPVRGQMTCFQPDERLFRRVIYSPRGYIVPRVDGRLLVGATVEDSGFDTETTDEGIESLREAAIEISASLSAAELVEQWAGLRPAAADGLPILGQISQIENLFVATAHYRNGILLAPFTAKIIADLITENRSSEFLPSFSPQRFRMAESGGSKV